jgi:hypothetical protein
VGGDIRGAAGQRRNRAHQAFTEHGGGSPGVVMFKFAVAVHGAAVAKRGWRRSNQSCSVSPAPHATGLCDTQNVVSARGGERLNGSPRSPIAAHSVSSWV